MFKKINDTQIKKPNEIKQETPKQPKTMLELLQEKNYTTENVMQELKLNGLTERESNAFIDIFVNGMHYTQVSSKYSIQFTEVMTLHSKFSILARKYGVDPNKIISMLR